jgi:two-component system sensor histidine kinase PhcS
MQTIPPEYRAEFQKEDRDKTIVKTQWGCIFGILLVPLFGVLDFYVFDHDQARSFLWRRLLCSGLMALLYPVLGTRFGKKYYRLQGIILLFLPSATIAWMVYETTGAASNYYAGLILVLMVLAVVLDWTFWQSVVAVMLVLLLYVAACWYSPAVFDSPENFSRLFVEHLFFLVSSGLAIIAGAYYHSDARIREFLLNKQLLQSEKMAATGIMSAGIIHNINNPLNFATTGLFTLRKKGRHLPAEQQADYAEVLTDIEDGLKRVQSIVSGLRPLTHPSNGQPRAEQRDPVPLAEAIQEALRFLDRGAVEIKPELAEHQTVWANKDRLVQVIENLLKNSLDALKTKTFAAGERPTIWITGHVENGQSILSVRDNGPGITDQNRSKIFDPFFTTKDVGAGMGLGLSNCYGIVREYGGKITLETVPGKFCEFILEFPRRPNQAVTGN